MFELKNVFFLLFPAALSTYTSAATSSYAANYESDIDSLPSYTIVTGLPSYDDALEQMRLKIDKRESLLRHPPLTSIFEQTATVDLISEKQSNEHDPTQIQASNYQVSVIVPQIVNAGGGGGAVTEKQKTEARDDQQLLHGLRRLSENTDSFNINLPIVLATSNGHGHGNDENCLKACVEPRKAKQETKISLEKIEVVNVRRGSRSSLQ